MALLNFGTRIGLGGRPTGGRGDPFGAYNFHLEVDGLIVGGFTNVSGLNQETKVIKKREGGRNDSERVFVDGSVVSDLVLQRGMADVDMLIGWYHEVRAGRIKRKNGTIYLLDDQARPKAYWDFEEAFPIKWDGPTLDASNSAVATESITLVHEKLTRGGQAAAGAFVRFL